MLLATASAAELSAALAPVRAAGLTIDRVLTPAAALVSVSRLYESVPGAGTIEAYVALDETAVALAIVRDNRLVAARDLPWGVLEEGPEGLAPRDYEALAARLGDELAALLPVGRLGPEGVSRICVCGGTPDLRSVAVLLIDRFDIEVEALDSLFGIDLRRLPYSLLEVRHELPALRLAWAAAVGGRPLLDLRRDVWRQVARRRWIRSAVAAGVVAGLGIGWTVAGQLPASTSALTGRLRRQLQTMMSASPSSSSNRAPDVATAPRRDEGPRTSAQAPGAPAPLPQAEASSQPAPPVEREVPVNRAAPPPQMPSRPSAQAVAKALPAPPPARVIEEPRQLAAQLPQPEPRRIAPGGAAACSSAGSPAGTGRDRAAVRRDPEHHPVWDRQTAGHRGRPGGQARRPGEGRARRTDHGIVGFPSRCRRPAARADCRDRVWTLTGLGRERAARASRIGI